MVLVDKDGQQIAVHGELGDLDTTSLASLVAGNVAATGGMAKLIGEDEFPTLSHEGAKESIHISVIGRVLLVVVFDDRSSLGLVKLAVQTNLSGISQCLRGNRKRIRHTRSEECAPICRDYR
mgnify:CR=1 FL=1